MTNYISSDLYGTTLQVRSHGLNGVPRGSIHLYEKARKAHRLDPFDTTAELNWRIAALIHGAHLAARGDWLGAMIAYDQNPDRLPEIPVPYRDHLELAAVMATGEAVAKWRYSRGPAQRDAGFPAATALSYFDQFHNAGYNRWRAVASTIQALTNSGPSSAAEIAKRYVDSTLQPELAVLIDHLNGEGDGRMSMWRGLRSRSATIQPTELYLFNEGRHTAS